ncbi:MAG: FAD-binding protein [Chloroflexi bacterium]|nr:FAD-binding protein [Chloroflexota bacterium]
MKKLSGELIESDVLVVGGGLGGALAAIAASQVLGSGETITIVDKGMISRSGQSSFAAGIFTAFDAERDDLDQWMSEIVEWGEYINDQDWCRLMFDRALPIVRQIDAWGAEMGFTIFERNPDGSFVRRRSRGHMNSKHMVVNSLPMMSTLRRKMIQQRVKVVDKVMVTDLLLDDDGQPWGAIGLDYVGNQVHVFKAKAIVLAASGCGFKSIFIGHRNLTGDMLAAAYEAGVEMRNLEQYANNTCARNYDIHGLNLYVGIGGKFLNAAGEEFMWKYHPVLGNRARLQDLVLAFCREIREGRGPIHLDMSAASPEDRALCRKILPESFLLWDRAGIDPFSTPVEWIPSFYGTITSGGGIHINTRCETNVKYLYAAGDITCEPPHGTYSFGGINLGFTAVSGWVAGMSAAEVSRERQASPYGAAEARTARQVMRKRVAPATHCGGLAPESTYTGIQETLVPVDVGYLKTEDSLQRALAKVRRLAEETLPSLGAQSSHELVKAIEVGSMIRVAELMIASALARHESRGFHFREEYPRTDNENWLKWIMVRKREAEPDVFTRDVPTPYVQPAEKYSIPPGMRRV